MLAVISSNPSMYIYYWATASLDVLFVIEVKRSYITYIYVHFIVNSISRLLKEITHRIFSFQNLH